MEKRAPVLLAFSAFVVIAGLNFVAVRFSNRELAPIWGAALRFGLAGMLFLLIALARRVPFPRGRALAGALLFGLLSFGLFYAFMYYALVRAPAGIASVVVALAPMLTLALAAMQGLERLRATSVAGALLATAGVAVAFAEQLRGSVPLLSLLALLGGALTVSQSTIVVKKFPRIDPFMMNAVAMLAGAAILLLISAFRGERWALPRTTEASLAVLYLVTVGGMGMFLLVLYVLSHWTASATSYQAVLSPLVAIAAAAALAGERPGLLLLAGGALVLAGVGIGAILPAHRARKDPSDFNGGSRDDGPVTR